MIARNDRSHEFFYLFNIYDFLRGYCGKIDWFTARKLFILLSDSGFLLTSVSKEKRFQRMKFLIKHFDRRSEPFMFQAQRRKSGRALIRIIHWKRIARPRLMICAVQGCTHKLFFPNTLKPSFCCALPRSQSVTHMVFLLHSRFFFFFQIYE